MDRVIYTALSGASAAMHRQQVLSHNLANVNTNGFRAEMATFRAVPLRGEGATTRVFALEATAGHLDTPGSMNSTGRNLDMNSGNEDSPVTNHVDRAALLPLIRALIDAGADLNARTREWHPEKKWLYALNDVSWVDMTGQEPVLLCNGELHG